MTPYQNRTSAICIRMAQDMKIRNLAGSTIDAYTYHVDRFEQFLETKNVANATPEDIRSFQLRLIEERKVGFSSFNQAVCGLRFLYSVTLPRDWHVIMIPFGKRSKTLPTVLGHASFATTMIYLHVRRNHLLRAPSPLDWLPTRQLPKWEDPSQPNDPTN